VLQLFVGFHSQEVLKMGKKMRRETMVGLVVMAVFFTLKALTAAPDLLMGLLCGFSLALSIIGSLPEKTYDSIKKWKHTTFHRGQIQQ
jgi:diacylglycerol kinase